MLRKPHSVGFFLDCKFNSVYNKLIMKPVSFVIEQPRQRRHQMLFDRDLPFRGRREQNKTVYRRRPKHPSRDNQ